MAILKIDPSSFDAMVLSHGHYDHFGGMVGFLNAHQRRSSRAKLPFYVGGEDCFCLRRNPGGNFGALDRKAILDADLTLMMAVGAGDRRRPRLHHRPHRADLVRDAVAGDR